MTKSIGKKVSNAILDLNEICFLLYTNLIYDEPFFINMAKCDLYFI